MKNTEFSVRAYMAPDLAKLSKIWFAASMQAHPFLGEVRLREQQILIENEYLPKFETWVACRNNEPVGFIGLVDTFIGALFVDQTLQGGGIGRALVAHALTLKGGLQLEVYADNTQACAVYERLGFKEISRRAEDDEGLPFENIQMQLNA